MFSLDSTWPFRDKDAPQEGTPTRMACTWTDTVMTHPGKKPERGFGGRVMFYEKDEAKPILVEGQLVVYAFDEDDRDPTDTKPTRRYVFPSDQVPLHMSKNELGASYSFYLPWDEAGGVKTEVSLICRFEPTDGPVITSEQTRHVLPGAMAPLTADGKKQPPKLPEGIPSKPARQTLQTMQAKRNEENHAQLASYEAPATPEQQSSIANGLPDRKMTSTTINLPGSFQMPNAAPMMSQPAAAPMQQVPNAIYQPAAAQPMPQHATRVYQLPPPTPSPAQAVQQMAAARPFNAGQPMVPSSAVMSPAVNGQPATTGFGAQGIQALGAQGTTMPVTQQGMPTFNGASAVPGNANPMSQLQTQQTALQQQLIQQQLMQQQALQQRMLPTPPVQQMPAQAGTTTASYPGAGLLR